MPNWCYTDYTLVGSEEDVKNLHDSLNNLQETPRSYPEDKWSFRNNSNWLGFIVEDILKEDFTKISCRGTFDCLNKYSFNGKHAISFTTETAWGPCYDLLDFIAEKYNLSVNYVSEEIGMCFFEKHDPDEIYARSYYFNDGESTEYYDTLEQFIVDHAATYNLIKNSSYEEVQEAVNNTDDGMFYAYKNV